jgi:membrane protease YdiL (CAAX protease family)
MIALTGRHPNTRPMDAPQSRPTPADLIAVLVALVLPTAITWVYFFGAAGEAKGVQAAVYGAVKVLQFGLPIGWVWLVQRGRVTLRPPGGQGVGIGLAFGAAVAAGMVALYAVLLQQQSDLLAVAEPHIRAKVAGFGINSLWKYAALGAFYSLIHSLLEEYYWRWFVFGQLRRFGNVPIAAVVSGLGFMSHHVLVLGKFFGFANPATYLLSACIAAGGVVWAWLYHRSGSLLGPWLSHLLVDAAIFGIGYHVVRGMLAT